MKAKKPINIEVGQNVKQVREQAGLTQERLAELIGLGEKHISAIECGAAGVSLPILRQLCSLLSVSADMILFGDTDNGELDERATAHQLITERLVRLSDDDFWAVKDILDKLLEVMAKNKQIK